MNNIALRSNRRVSQNNIIMFAGLQCVDLRYFNVWVTNVLNSAFDVMATSTASTAPARHVALTRLIAVCFNLPVSRWFSCRRWNSCRQLFRRERCIEKVVAVKKLSFLILPFQLCKHNPSTYELILIPWVSWHLSCLWIEWRVNERGQCQTRQLLKQ